LQPGHRPTEVCLLKRAVLVCLALLVSGPAAAGEMQNPIITLNDVNWGAAAASLPDRGTQSPAEAFARLNAITSMRFAGIEKSAVPVLLPFDVDSFRKDMAVGKDAAENKPEAANSEKYFGGFHPTKFFLAGPAGYDATFTLSNKEDRLKIRFEKPIVFEISGAAFIYDLDGPDHIEKEMPPPKELADAFPGIRRILSEAHLRYVFQRFGVPYVLSIQCYDMHPSSRYLGCKEADPLALRFLKLLHIAGGTPAKIKEPTIDLSRPAPKSDFTYYGPGDLIENTGWKKRPGRVDYHVYARMRFPIARPPAYVKSQSFLPWGDCYRTGHTGRLGRKGASYQCKVNGKPLVFDESAAVNFTYPWRDNFCEQRDFLVGQCPGGYGHQGEDIRPAQCVLNNAEADRCLPYQDYVAAVHDGVIRRMPGNLGAYIVVNSENNRVRFRYLHMNPKFMDADGLLNGRQVSEGEIIGKVATWGDHENGTSYHLHFNIQVFTAIGWVWVNPYMTLVAAYERLVGGRGTEIEPGEPEPQVPVKLPVVLQPTPPSEVPAASASPPAAPVASSAAPVKIEQDAARAKPHKRHRILHRRRRRHRVDD
jgi:murein DD-endopeptidase MepM/ murein hydrolase activator NlpD